MRLGGGNHGASAAVRTFTVGVMAAAIFAQLLSLSHEMTVRHFRCAEHGELTHVAALASAGGGSEEGATARTTSAVRAPEREVAGAHEHCGVAFTVEGSSCTPSAGGAVGRIAAAPPVRPTSTLVVPLGRAGVLASAPKTSPPAA